MIKNWQVKSRDIALAMGVYGLTALLAVLWAVLGIQLYTLTIYLGILVVQTPALTPTGWNSSTIAGLSKCAILILTALWLGVSTYTHNHLNEARERQRLLVESGRLMLIIGGIYALSAGLFYVLG